MTFYVGIDIGGTQTRMALIDQVGIIKKEVRFETFTEDVQQQLEYMAKELAVMTASYEYRSIGIASPGPLNAQAGIIGTPPNLPKWHGFKIVDTFSQMTGKTVFLENDANLAAFAEATVGAGYGQKIVQYFTISTGIGGGLVINGELYTGANGLGLEVANCTSDRHNQVDGNTQPGSIERICSGTGILNQAQAQNLPVTTTKEVFQLAASSEMSVEQVQASQLLAYVSQQFGDFLATIQGIIDPSIIVLGGSVALYNPTFVAAIEHQMQTRVYENIRRNCQIRLASLGDAAGVIGAALWSKAQSELLK
ncbi:MAG: ROK family protein [Culicoidibacterales bacterium]